MTSFEKTRVLFPFVGDTVGGSHISALTLVRGLQGSPFEPVIAVHSSGKLEDYLAQNGFTWQTVEAARGPIDTNFPRLLGTAALKAAPLARYLKSERIEIVHSNDTRMHLLWLAASKLAGCRQVWHQRTVPRVPVLRGISRLADRVVGISQASVPRQKNSVVVPNPVAPIADLEPKDVCRKTVLEAIAAPPEARLVCWVANWIEVKRPLQFLEIAREVLDLERRPVKFLMIGEPRAPMERTVLEHIASLDLAASVHVLGTRWPIEPWIAGCDLLVATAVGEALGRTLVEAMLAGTPVVATADAGHLEVVDHGRTGWLVPPGDIEGFARAVVNALENPDATTEVAATARTEALAKYSPEQHVRTMESIYASVLRA